MSDSRWVPDYSLDAPDGHVWARPPSLDCPDCPCCTDTLCHTAREKRRPCWHLVSGGPADGVMSVTGCPCTVPVELRRLDGIRADVLATVRARLVDHPAPPDEVTDEPVPASYGDDPARVYVLVTCNPAGGDPTRTAQAVVRAAAASGLARTPRHAWTHGLVLLESTPQLVTDLVVALAAVTVPAGVGEGEVPAVASTHQLTADEGRQVHAINAAKHIEIWGTR